MIDKSLALLEGSKRFDRCEFLFWGYWASTAICRLLLLESPGSRRQSCKNTMPDLRKSPNH